MARSISKGRGHRLTTAYWSPNRLRYALDVREPAVLVVNQNYYPSWRAHDGRRVTSHNGLLSVEVGPDDRFVGDSAIGVSRSPWDSSSAR